MYLKIKTIGITILSISVFLFSSFAIALNEVPDQAITPKMKALWEFNNNAFTNKSFISNDGTLYFITNDGISKLFAMTPEGKEKWQLVLPYQPYSAPIIDGEGMIYVYGRNLALYAIYPSGYIKWQITIPHNSSEYANLSIPLTVGKYTQRIYTTTSKGKIYAITADGSVDWKYLPLLDSSINTPVFESGNKLKPTVYFVLNRNIAKEDESTELHQTKEDKVDKIIMQRPGYIYFFSLSTSGKMYIVSRKNYASTIEVLQANGKSLWNVRTNGSSVLAALDTNETLYYVGIENNQNFVAARGKDGKLLWKNNYPNWVYDLLLADNKVIVPYNTSLNPARQKILIFSKENGRLLCESDEFKFLFAYVNAHGKNIYLSTHLGISAFESC